MTERPDWERDLLRDIALEGIKERRRARRWGIFFRFLTFGYLIALLILAPSCSPLFDTESVGRHTAVVRVEGLIAPDAPANAERIIQGLREAFAAPAVAGVMLRIDSPGGSPVEAGRIVDELHRLRARHPDVPVYAVGGNLMTSGAYYIAVGADSIYADKASLVGSIGVVMGGFGFTEAMRSLGVERRLYTAGTEKAFLDPFSPVDEDEVEHIEQMLDQIHEQFIAVVREGRGERLHGDPDRLFSGLFWTGERSVQLGLVDGLGSPGFVARELIGAAETVDYTPGRSWFERLSDDVGASIARTLWTLASAPGGALR